MKYLGFLKRTIKDKRYISVDNEDTLFTWVDSFLVVQEDMKGHTGGVMSTDGGIFHGESSTQKIDTKSNTESELVGVSKYLPYNIWYMLFLGAQGYTIENNVLFQANKSAIKMETNGRNSCTGDSRHIEIKYFG